MKKKIAVCGSVGMKGHHGDCLRRADEAMYQMKKQYSEID